MKRFYDFYSTAVPNLPQAVEDFKLPNFPQVVEISEITNCPQVVSDFIFSVPWGHHRTIIDKYYKTGELDTAIFYLKNSFLQKR